MSLEKVSSTRSFRPSVAPSKIQKYLLTTLARVVVSLNEDSYRIPLRSADERCKWMLGRDVGWFACASDRRSDDGPWNDVAASVSVKKVAARKVCGDWKRKARILDAMWSSSWTTLRPGIRLAPGRRDAATTRGTRRSTHRAECVRGRC